MLRAWLLSGVSTCAVLATCGDGPNGACQEALMPHELTEPRKSASSDPPRCLPLLLLLLLLLLRRRRPGPLYPGPCCPMLQLLLLPLLF
ncbi:unnamed protein product [Lampetra planeri]